MIVKRKVIFYGAGILALLIGALLYVNINILSYKRQIPEIPDLTAFNEALKEQIIQTSKKASSLPTAENLGRLGMVYHSSANYEEAEQCYKLAIRKNKEDWKWYYYLGYLNREMGYSREVVENFKEVVEINPAIDHAWFYAGEGFQNLNFYSEAETAYQKIAGKNFVQDGMETSSARVDFFPLNIYAKYQLARMYLDIDQLNDAERILAGIVGDTKSFGPAYRLIGSLYDKKGDSGMSNYYITRANDLTPYSEPVDTIIDALVRISRSEVYILKQIDEAEKSVNIEWIDELVTNALTYIPDNIYLISKAIKSYLLIDYGDKAISLTDKHLELFQNDPGELQQVAMMFFDKGHYKQAMLYYNQALELSPDDYLLKSQAAICEWQLEEKEKATENIISMLDQGRDNPDILINGITLLLMFDETDKAVPYLNVLKRLVPGNPSIYRFEGVIAEREGNVKRAITLYEQAFQAVPDEMINVKNLIDLVIYDENWQKALNYLYEAMKTHPNDPYILERTGSLLVTCEEPGLRNMNLGKELSERAFFHSNSEPGIMISAGRSLSLAYANLQEFQNARLYMDIVLNLAQEMNMPKEFIDDLTYISHQLKGHE